MTITLVSALARTSTRVRMIFSGALGAGAFVASLYQIGDVSLSQPGPTVKAAIAVANQTNQVELVLASALTPGDAIAAYATNVPAADASLCTGAVTTFFGQVVTFTPDAEPEQNDADDLIFGVDLVHNGQDYVEDATADLATVSGLQNVQGANTRRVRAYGLPWDQTYGPRLDDYVDGPTVSATPATGLIKQNLLADDRNSQVTCTLESDDTAAGGAVFKIAVKLKTGRPLPPFDVAVASTTSSSDANTSTPNA